MHRFRERERERERESYLSLVNSVHGDWGSRRAHLVLDGNITERSVLVLGSRLGELEVVVC